MNIKYMSRSIFTAVFYKYYYDYIKILCHIYIISYKNPRVKTLIYHEIK